MKSLILSIALVCTSFAVFAEVKVPGTAVPIACGKNEVQRTVPGVTEVCQVMVVETDKTGLSVKINKGALTVNYFYQYYKPVGLMVECGRVGSDTNCLHHARLAGVIGAKGIVDFAPIQTLPSDDIVVYTTHIRKGTSMSAEFLKMKFEAKSLEPVMVTQ